MAAAQVAAQRTVTRRTLDNGMVKFEVVVSSDEATIVWAALNAASAKAGAEPTGAEPIFADQTPAELLLAPPPTAKAATSVERGQQRADAFMGIIQDRVRGNRPQRTPIEIIITVPHAGLHGPAGPSDLAMMADERIHRLLGVSSDDPAGVHYIGAAGFSIGAVAASGAIALPRPTGAAASGAATKGAVTGGATFVGATGATAAGFTGIGAGLVSGATGGPPSAPSAPGTNSFSSRRPWTTPLLSGTKR